jgi:hypothetical protein
LAILRRTLLTRGESWDKPGNESPPFLSARPSLDE